jgi:hypothetical protein
LLLAMLPRVRAADTSIGEEKVSYKFGAFPMMAVGQMHSVFSSIAAEFTKVLGHPVYFRIKPTFITLDCLLHSL